MYAADVHRLILDLSTALTAEDLIVCERAFLLIEHALTTVTAAMRDVEHAQSSTTPWPTDAQAQYAGLLRCADETASRLYFASGAFRDDGHQRQPLPPNVFYAHAKPILTELARIGHPHTVHHIMQTLQYFIATDPAGVLLLAGDVVRAGAQYGYQYEPLAEGIIVKIVEQYLAEYRQVIREHPGCHAAIMDILDVFVSVGWPSAHRLTYHLSEIYR
jgi:hypothetical protein